MAAVKFITYNGKKLPIKLGIYTMMLVQEEHGIVLGEEGLKDEKGDSLKPSQYMPLLYHSLEQGHRLTKKPFEFEMEDMHDILNECFLEFVSALPEFFPSEEPLEKIMGMVEGKKEKTKAQPTTQSSSAKQSRRSGSARKK